MGKNNTREWGLRVSAPLRRRMGETPIMRNDILVLPLQAADMLVWSLRRRYEGKSDNDIHEGWFQEKWNGVHLCTLISGHRDLTWISAGTEAARQFGAVYESGKARSRRLRKSR